MRVTPTGIEIRACDECGYVHPVTRTHCIECGRASVFKRPDGVCVKCGGSS